MNLQLIAAVGLLAGFIGLAAIFHLSTRSATAREREELQLEEERLLALHQKGLVTEYGEAVCIVDGCKLTATRPYPMIDQPAFDKRWPVSFIIRMYSLGRRHSVEEDPEDRSLCATHGRQAREKGEHFVARLRAKNADENAKDLEQVAVMNNGGMLKLLANQDKKIADTLGVATTGTSVPALPVHETVSLPPRIAELIEYK